MIKLLFLLCGQYIGSFLHVVAFRVPKGIYFSNNRSFCHNCYKNLNWYELVPILSYAMQGGKCTRCKDKISFLHPFSEFTGGILFLMCYLKFGGTYHLIYSLLFVSLLLVLTIADIYYYILPNVILILLAFVVLLWNCQLQEIPTKDAVFSFLFSLLLVGFLILFTNGGMGVGDFKLLAILAYFFGFHIYLQLLVLSSSFALLYFIYLNFSKKFNKVPLNQQMIFFGPFISLAACILLFFNN